MKTPIIERLEVIRKRSGLSFERVAERSAFSSSTLRRWWKGESVPTVEDLETLAESMGGSINEIFIEVGKQEMIATQDIAYQGATAMVARYEAQLAAMQDKIALVEQHSADALSASRQQYERVVEYLKSEIEDLQEKNRKLMAKVNQADQHAALADQRAAAAEQHAKDIDRRRHHVFWGMLALCFAMLAVGISVYPPWA